MKHFTKVIFSKGRMVKTFLIREKKNTNKIFEKKKPNIIKNSWIPGDHKNEKKTWDANNY